MGEVREREHTHAHKQQQPTTITTNTSTSEKKRLKRNLKRQKWIDPSTADLIEKNPSLGIRRAEIITGLASLMHPIMGKVNPVAYSKANIFAAVTSNAYIHLGSEIADYFLEKVSI